MRAPRAFKEPPACEHKNCTAPWRRYHAAFNDAKEGDELVLLTAPLAATSEVEALFTAGLIDVESALPAALHSLGASASEIDGALKRRREADALGADSKLLEAQTAAQMGDADVKLKAAQAAKTTEEIESVRAGVEKTRAEIGKVNADAKKAEHDVKAPFASPAASASGGGAGASGSSSGGSGKK